MIDPKLATIVRSLHGLLTQYERYEFDRRATQARKDTIVGPMSVWHETMMKDIDKNLARYEEAALQQERAFRCKLIQLRKLIDDPT